MSPSQNPDNKASAFANWVFKKEHPPLLPKNTDFEEDKAEERMRRGILSHRRINMFFDQRWVDRYLGSTNRSEWKLIYRDEGSPEDPILKCSSLKIGDQPMRCRPDAVLKHKKTGKILIIEYKTTRKRFSELPAVGWSNIEAQLWCYSWIDNWLDATDVELFGYIWHRRGHLSPGRHPFKWIRGEEQHHKKCKALYEEYGGVYIKQ